MSTPRFLDRPFGDNLFINPLYELDEKIRDAGFRNATLKAQYEGYRTGFENLLKALSQPAQIVVAGSFNAGKSSFINTLLGGQEIMPVLAVRCTASVNCLIKGEKRELIVHRPGGNTDRFNYTDTDLAKQVRTLMKQERNRIERIDITRPDLHFLDKFTLIDTPGLDYNEQDTSASRACIQRADAMIWVLHPEGMRNEDLQIIREFHDANPASPLIVIINRIDKLDEEEITTVVADVKIRLQNITDQVFPLSAYLACQGLQEKDEIKVKQSRFHELSYYLHNHLFTAYRDLQNQRLSQKWSEQAQALARDMENFLRLHYPAAPTGSVSESLPKPTSKPAPNPAALIAGRYEKTANGQEVIDHQTGLIWRADIERRAAKTEKKGFFFTEAARAADEFNFREAQARAKEVAQQTGLPWRVPTRDELVSLVDRSRRQPASAFPDMPPIWFWSSSPYVGYAYFAWLVFFSSGDVSNFNRYDTLAVRLVRGG